MTYFRSRPLVVALAAAALAGCQNDEIRTYRVDKTAMTRLLGAILPHGDSTWFFKVSGPTSVVAGHDKEFVVFLQSLGFLDGDDKPLAWELPPGWKLDKAKRADRYATIFVGEKDALELTITRLGREGQASSVLANVNRWRNQLALPPIGEDELRSDIKELKAVVGTITVVDLTGTGSGKTGSKAPFARGDRMPPAAVKEKKADLVYQAPQEWTTKPNNAFSKVAFEVREGADKADVTVTPLGAAGGELTSNVNRWRGQIDLSPLGEAEIRKSGVDMAVDNKAAQYFDLKGKSQRILGVRIEDGATVWFVKMTGPVGLVEKQKTNFDTFVKSLRFAGD
jgi:hypothetical protein